MHGYRLEEKITFYPADVVLFEGILVFYPQKVRDMFHMKLFVDTDSDVRLSRRGKDARTPPSWFVQECRHRQSTFYDFYLSLQFCET